MLVNNVLHQVLKNYVEKICNTLLYYFLERLPQTKAVQLTKFKKYKCWNPKFQ